MSPEHLHLVTNHLPFLGLGLAMIPLVFGLLGRNRAALGSGLLIAFLCGWSVILVMSTGEEAYERYEHAGNYGISLDSGAEKWLETHEEDAHFFQPVFYIAAGTATVALMLCIVGSRMVYPLSWIVFLLCGASLACGILIADSGGKIRRPDFRPGTSTGILMESSPENLPDALHGRFDVFS
ncbi:MAG: hypothetical protein ACP5I4_01825 [Oceanipulchritudo sp.]|jgi:hypothetical protein